MSSDDTIVNRAEEGEEMEHSPPSPQDWSPSPERGHGEVYGGGRIAGDDGMGGGLLKAGIKVFKFIINLLCVHRWLRAKRRGQ